MPGVAARWRSTEPMAANALQPVRRTRLPDGADLAAELHAAVAIARKEIRIARRYPLNLANEVLQPLYQFLLPSLLLGATFAVGGRSLGLAASAGTDDLAGYLFLGIVVAALVGAAFWEIAFSFKREMDVGTLEPAWLTPTRPETLVIGRALSAFAIGGSASLVLVGIGWIVFGASFSAAALIALPALAVAALSLVGIGYLIASIVLLMRDPNFFVDAANFGFMIITGVAFPVTVLPGLIRPIAYLLPTTYALDLLRHAALGTRPLLAPSLEWAALVALAALTLAVGRTVFLRTEHRLRVRGTLGQH
jgi:ABC-type polysaccharide/polyol phosphate export permease